MILTNHPACGVMRYPSHYLIERLVFHNMVAQQVYEAVIHDGDN